MPQGLSLGLQEEVIAVLAGERTDDGVDGSSLVDISGAVAEGELKWDVPAGAWRIEVRPNGSFRSGDGTWPPVEADAAQLDLHCVENRGRPSFFLDFAGPEP